MILCDLIVILTGILVPIATITRPIVNSPTPRRHPKRATTVIIMKLIAAIQKIDIRNEAVTTYHLRFLEQFGMVHVNATKNGNEMTKRVILKMYFIHPNNPPSLASVQSGGAALIGGKNGIRVIVGSSSLSVLPVCEAKECTALMGNSFPVIHINAKI